MRLPLAESRDAESALLFALRLRRGARAAHAARAAHRGGDRPARGCPSRFLLRLASSLAGRPVGLDEFVGGAPLAAVWRRGGARPPVAGDDDARAGSTLANATSTTLLALGTRGRRATARAYLEEVLGDRAAVARRLHAWRAGRDPEPGAWDGLLGGEARAALAARRLFAAEMHPTRLERYVGCPFAFLLRDVLGLEAPDEPGASLDMDAREFGTLAHDILERTYARVIAGELDGRAASTSTRPSPRSRPAWETGCAAGRAARRDRRRARLGGPPPACSSTTSPSPSAATPSSTRGDGRPVAGRVALRRGRTAGRLARARRRRRRALRRPPRPRRRAAAAAPASSTTRPARAARSSSVSRTGSACSCRSTSSPCGRPADGPVGEIACVYRLVTRRGGFADLALAEAEAAATARLRRLVATIVALVDAGVFARSTGGRCEYCDVGYACGAHGLGAGAQARAPGAARLWSTCRSWPGGGDDDAGA